MKANKLKLSGLLVMFLILLVALTACDTGEFVGEVRYELTVEKEGEGVVTPAEGTHEYDEDTFVELKAEPAEWWEFGHWTGDVEDPDSAGTNILMDEDKEVTAVFKETFETYSDDYYRIRYPQDWEQELEDGDLILHLDITGIMMVMTEEYDEPIDEGDFHNFISELENEFEEDDYIDIDESSSRTLDEQPAHSFILLSYEGSAENSGINLKEFNNENLLNVKSAAIIAEEADAKIKMVLTFKENHLFMLAYAHNINYFEVYLDEVNKVLDSFEFLF